MMDCTFLFKIRLALMSSVAVSALLALPASAQQAPAGSAVELQQVDVVAEGAGSGTATGAVNGYVATRSTTGSKSNTPIIAIPQAVSVVGQQEIEDRNAQTVDEALRYTAGVAAQTYGPDPDTDWFYIRGFQATQTGVFLDGMQLYSYGFGGFQIDPFLLERIEVLKGPASVLYGGSNPGGIINLVSKRPTGEPFGFVETGINNWGNGYGQMDVGGASEDKDWTYRITGKMSGGDQFTDYSKDLKGTIMPQVTWKPSEETKVTAYAILSALDQVHVGGGFLPYVGTVRRAPFGRIDPQAFYGEPSLDDQKRTQAMFGYEWEQDIGAWTFNQSARYGTMRGSQVGPYGYGYYNAETAPYGNALEPTGPDNLMYRIGFKEHTEVNTFTTDNRIRRAFDTGPVNHSLLLGVDYKYFNIDQVQASGGATPISITDPVYGVPQGKPSVYLDQDLTQHQVGTYVQDQLRFGDGWIVTLNGRYDYVHQESRSPADLPYSPTFDTHDEALSGRAGIAYEFDNGVTPYFSAATFFNPIFDVNYVTDGADRPFKPEEGYQFEGGVKYAPTFMDALITASGFHIVKQNVLTPRPTAIDPTAQDQLGEVTSTGFEIEGKANITENWRVLGSFTAYDLETTKDTRRELIGKTPIVAPEMLASGWVDYTVKDGAFEGVSVGGGVRYVGPSYADALNAYKVPGATLFDAALRYEKNGWGAAINVNNIFDKVYVKSCNGISGCGYGDTRTITVSAHYKW